MLKLLQLVGEGFVLYLLYTGVVKPYLAYKSESQQRNFNKNQNQNFTQNTNNSASKNKQPNNSNDGEYIDYEEIK